MTVIDAALEANKAYAAEFKHGDLPMPPARKLAIVTCMDARIHPEKALGFQEGDVHMIRNAGGRIVDALRSLAISQELLGTEEVAIIHHTDCGMLTFSDADIRSRFAAKGVNADHIAFLPFSDVEESVKADIELYKQSPLVRHDVPIRGFVFDVATGRISEVA